jgi:hypothetical protein
MSLLKHSFGVSLLFYHIWGIRGRFYTDTTQIDACIFWSFFYRWEVGRGRRRHDAN